MHLDFRPILALGIATLLGSLVVTVINEQRSTTTQSLKVLKSESQHSARLDYSHNAQQIAHEAIQGSAQQTADKIAQISTEEILSLVTAFEHSLEGSKQERAEFLIELCSTIAETNPKNALLLIGSFHYLPGVPNFEREVFTSWITNDVSGTLSYLDKENTTATGHHIAVAASVFQNEQHEYFPKYLEWASSFKYDPQDDQANVDHQIIFADAVTKLTTFVNENTIEGVLTFLEEHADIPVAASNLATLLESSLMHYPEDADDWFNWLAELPVKSNEMRTLLVSSAIGGLTEHDPDKVVSLLSSQEFLDQQYLPDSKTETPAQREENQRIFFDDILERYLEKNIQFDPEAALIGAQAFHDQERRKEMEEWARTVIRNSPDQDTPHTEL